MTIQEDFRNNFTDIYQNLIDYIISTFGEDQINAHTLMNSLLHALIDLNEDEFNILTPKVSSFIENRIDDDSYKEAIYFGFLENLHILENRDQFFKNAMLPKSKQILNEIDKFWDNSN